MRVIYPGFLWFKDHNSPYQLLRHLEPGLCLDIGAAEGRTAVRMADASPNSNVCAYEPFEGNIPHFKKMVADRKNIKLIEKAVADFDGKGKLYVASTLKGTEKGWEGRKGYSSSGMLVSKSEPTYNDVKSAEVEVCSVDGTVAQHVRFMKVDVQGGEIGVLNGAKKTIRHHGIDIIFIEYEGDRRIIDFLLDEDYVLFDSGQYLYSQKKGGPSAKQVSPYFRSSSVASGREVAAGPIESRPLGAEDYIKFFDDLGHMALHTDLVCVRKEYLGSFYNAATALLN